MSEILTENQIRQLIVELGRRLWEKSFVAANDGNISVKLNENEIICTPTGVSKGFMTTDMLIKIDSDGDQINFSTKYKPSTEILMHRTIYKHRPDVKAVMHAHPPYATSFAVAGIKINTKALPEAAVYLGVIPIAPYATPSTKALSNSILPYLQNDVLLLGNHGAVTMADNLMSAYFKLETLEHVAKIDHFARRLGNVNQLPDEEIELLKKLYR